MVDEISRLLNIGIRQVYVNDVKTDLKDVILRATLYPTDFTGPMEFSDLIESLNKIVNALINSFEIILRKILISIYYFKLSDKQVSLNINNSNYKLTQSNFYKAFLFKS